MKTKLLILSATIFLSAIRGSAGQEGHGGGAFVCLNTQGEIVAAESEDLNLWSWETPAMGYVPRPDPTTPGTEQELAYQAIEKLRPINRRFYVRVKAVLDIIFKHREIVPIALPYTLDPHPVSDKACPAGTIVQFRQAAIFNDKPARILFAKEVFDAMKNIDRSALSVHEAIYALLRMSYEAKDSKRTQEIVARLFSPLDDLENAPIPKGCTINTVTGVCEWDLRISVEGVDPDVRSKERVDWPPTGVSSAPLISGGGAAIAWTYAMTEKNSMAKSTRPLKEEEGVYLRMGSSVKISVNEPNTVHGYMVLWNPNFAPVGTAFDLKIYVNEELVSVRPQQITKQDAGAEKDFKNQFIPRYFGSISLRKPYAGFCDLGVNCDPIK